MTVFANHLPYVLDPNVLPEAEKFDPMRMYRLRLKPGQENMHQWVMYSDLNQTFGAGRHACPGRFFAANEIKTLIVLAVMKFDVRMKSQYTLDNVFRGTWHNEVRTSILDAVIEVKSRDAKIPQNLKHCF
ncbi:hypothetical protein FDECE_3458 [Fusarium decemcellulare]|nr:hypothetical protein FDECE_3458 [Fusarium decemcellulare]